MLKTNGAFVCLMCLCSFSAAIGAQTSPPPMLTILTNTREAVEGQKFAIGWEASPYVVSVAACFRADRTPLGKRSRGIQSEVIAQRVPGGAGGTTWTVPWIDSLRFRVYVKGFNAAGEMIGEADAPLLFRPRELASQTRDAIYVDLSNRQRQRLYLQKSHELVQVAICSGSSTNHRIASHNCPRRIHDHLGWFRITQKDSYHISTLNPEWIMRDALRFHRAHFIHTTSRTMYRRLGHPASHGCIRLHRVDGHALYCRSHVGDAVCVY